MTLSQSGRRFLILLGIALALLSLALLAYALLPGSEPLRVQATLAPTLFVPLPGSVP